MGRADPMFKKIRMWRVFADPSQRPGMQRRAVMLCFGKHPLCVLYMTILVSELIAYPSLLCSHLYHLAFRSHSVKHIWCLFMTSGTGPGQSHEAGAASRSPTWMQGQAFAAFQGTLVGSWIQCRATEPQSIAYMGSQHHRQRLNLLHNTGPKLVFLI